MRHKFSLHHCLKSLLISIESTHKFYKQANLLLRKFSHCSDDVYCVLLQSYCTNIYCSQLSFNCMKNSLMKLSTSYSSVLRCLLCISKPYSASNMFISRGIRSFAQLLRNQSTDLKPELSLVQTLL